MLSKLFQAVVITLLLSVIVGGSSLKLSHAFLISRAELVNRLSSFIPRDAVNSIN